MFLRSVASTGSKGTLHTLHLEDQLPCLRAVETSALHVYASKLGVRVESHVEVVDAQQWTALELQHEEEEDEDVKWNRNIGIEVKSMLREGTLLSRGSRTQFSKLVKL